MKKICGLPTCDEVAHVLAITPVCRPSNSKADRVAKLPRCLEHLCPTDDYEPIPGRRQPTHKSKSFDLIQALKAVS